MKTPRKLNKKPINVRLNQRTLLMLTLLEEKLHATKTAVIEKALQSYANQKLKFNNPLMQYAGVLSANESETMLEAIKRDRMNKSIKAKL